MLVMIQRVFYGALGDKPESMPTWDLVPREHLELWPIAILMLVMGIASPIWLRAIDQTGTAIAHQHEDLPPPSASRARPTPRQPHPRP